MIDRKWQRKHDYLNSRFLSLGLICSKDFINGAPDLVIPLSSVKPFLGEDPPAPMRPSRDEITPYTEKDREENFRPFFGYDPRTAEERNPSYAKALRDAEERMRQRKLMKNK